MLATRGRADGPWRLARGMRGERPGRVRWGSAGRGGGRPGAPRPRDRVAPPRAAASAAAERRGDPRRAAGGPRRRAGGGPAGRGARRAERRRRGGAEARGASARRRARAAAAGASGRARPSGAAAERSGGRAERRRSGARRRAEPAARRSGRRRGGAAGARRSGGRAARAASGGARRRAQPTRRRLRDPPASAPHATRARAVPTPPTFRPTDPATTEFSFERLGESTRTAATNVSSITQERGRDDIRRAAGASLPTPTQPQLTFGGRATASCWSPPCRAPSCGCRRSGRRSSRPDRAR